VIIAKALGGQKLATILDAKSLNTYSGASSKMELNTDFSTRILTLKLLMVSRSHLPRGDTSDGVTNLQRAAEIAVTGPLREFEAIVAFRLGEQWCHLAQGDFVMRAGAPELVMAGFASCA
jgi:hypothetical protein